MNRDELDRTIDRYLEGQLTQEQAVQLEQILMSPEGSEALSQELLVRDFLYNLPPESPPEGLIERLQWALPIATEESEPERAGHWWESTRLALIGARWAVLGPAMAVRAPLGTVGETQASRKTEGFASGMTTVLRLGAAPGKVLRFGTTSGKALRLATTSGKTLRQGISSGRALGSGVSTVVGALSGKRQSRPRWQRSLDWIWR